MFTGANTLENKKIAKDIQKFNDCSKNVLFCFVLFCFYLESVGGNWSRLIEIRLKNV